MRKGQDQAKERKRKKKRNKQNNKVNIKSQRMFKNFDEIMMDDDEDESDLEFEK